jgi:polyhydroxyalkanoate synthesis repressor PhaR
MLVKKYGNRRLYDTEASRYITLEELSARIQEGVDVMVVDAKTGLDLTQATLAQIILESRGAAKLLPVPLLKQLVRMEDDALAEFFGRYMAWALEVYVSMWQGAQAIMPWNPFASMPLLSQNPLTRLFSGVMSRGDPPRPPPPPRAPAGAGQQAAQEELAELRREVEELKRAMGRRQRK